MHLYDLPGVAAGLALGPLVFVAPGLAVGWAGDLLGFRSRPVGVQLLLALPLSLAVAPLLAFLLMRPAVPGLVWAGFGVTWAVSAWWLVRNAGRLGAAAAAAPRGPAVAAVVAFLGCTAVMVGSLVDVEVDGGLYRPLANHDTVKHTFVAEAISRTGVPPVNPCYYPGRPLPMYYYYLWFILPSLTDQLGGPLVNPREAVTACTVWTGFAFVALIAVYLRLWDVRGLRPGRPAAAVGIALLAVTGLDVIPFWWSRLYGLPYQTPHDLYSLEWWNEDQVTAWANVILWVPHHLSGFAACFTGYLLLDDLVARRRGNRTAAGLVAGAAFASALGQSIWVGVTGAAVLAAWFAFVLARRDRAEVVAHLAVAGVTLALAAPFVLDLQRSGHLAGSPVVPHVRQMTPVNAALDTWGVTAPPTRAAVHFLLLPVLYLIELGFFLPAAVVYWRYRRRLGVPLSRQETFLLFAAGVGLLVSTFLRAAIVNNDFGWRATMYAQLPLLWWVVPVVQGMFGGAGEPAAGGVVVSRGGRAALAILLGVGVFGTVCELVFQRCICEGERGRPALELRQGYVWADEHLPRDAVLQPNPDRDYEYMFGQYAFRQTAVVDRVYGGLFGLNPDMLAEVYDPCLRMFRADATREEVVTTCRRFGIDVFVLRAGDPLWEAPGSWARTCPAVYENPSMRLIRVDDLAGRVTAGRTASGRAW